MLYEFTVMLFVVLLGTLVAANDRRAGKEYTIRKIQILDIEWRRTAQFAIDHVQIDAAVAYAFALVGIVGSVPILHAASRTLCRRR